MQLVCGARDAPLWGDTVEVVISALKAISDVVWGPIMLVLLVGTGLYLTIGLRFFPFRNWMRSYSCLCQGRSHQSADGEISPWNALMTALAGTIGTGSIVGVATAISVGGPGALFWMWVTAVVGMVTKFAEVMLSVQFREKTPAGNWVGGAMYFIKNGLGRRWAWMGALFCIFCMIACMGTGAMVQANAISANLAETFNIPVWVTALALLLLAGIVIIGGVSRVGAVAGRLVPFMACLYCVLSLLVIGSHITEIPSVIWMIFRDAFTPAAAGGGFAGATVMMAIRQGMARGVFSNEAGLGTAPMAHAASTAHSPLTQASIGMLDVFITTLVICSMTGFAILVTGAWSSGVEGGIMTAAAYEKALPGIGKIGVTVCLALFAFTTALGWCVYGERCAIYLFGDRAQLPFRIIYVLVFCLGALLSLEIVWLASDIGNALMAFPNLVGILLLSPFLFRLVREEAQKDPRFTV